MGQPITKISPTSKADALWAAYWQDTNAQTRNDLIVHYLPLVKFAAIRLSGRRGPMADIDDLLQYGIFGLKDAIGSFDKSRGFKFETYCAMRVRGAMLDGLKAQQWVPRELRQKINRFNETHQELTMQQGDSPEDDVLAARLGICPTTIRTLERDATAMVPMSLYAGQHDQGEEYESSHADAVADTREADPLDHAQREDVRELFMRELSRTERTLMMLYYYEEMTMREIGEALGISGTRVSQMHTDIIERLRERLTRRVTEPTGRTLLTIDL